jgi:Lar family restriction alleviation protein
MGSDTSDQFTDMDGNPVEDAPEPLPCPFCGSGGEQLVVERWSDEGDPDASHHVECLKCGSNGPQSDTPLGAAQAWNGRAAAARR